MFTSDNPRSENPESIIEDIVSGVSNYNNNKILVEVERSKAIEEARKNSAEGDIVLIAGKGHEDSHKFKNKVIKCDVVKIAQTFFNKSVCYIIYLNFWKLIIKSLVRVYLVFYHLGQHFLLFYH